MASSRNRQQPEALADELMRRLSEYDLAGKRLCVGLSGGVDSVVLMKLMVDAQPRLGYALQAVHVNHGLSDHAIRWAAFCQGFCDDLGVRLHVQPVSVPRAHALGLEAAAREVRHRVFQDAGADYVVLAHHRGDQVETLLHRLVRGAGVSGAAAMAMESSVPGGAVRLLRPLLGVSRGAIEAFARQAGLAWVTDESNADRRFARNFLRHEILPRLSQKFPGAEAALARAAGLFAEADGLLSDLALMDVERARAGEGLCLTVLRELGQARVRNLLRGLLRQWGLAAPGFERLHESVRQVLHSEGAIEWAPLATGCGVAVFDGMVYFLREGETKAKPRVWAGERSLPWLGGRLELTPAEGAGISVDKIGSAGLELRARCGGERLALGMNRPHKGLKKLFQEQGVPFWLRRVAPVLWSGDRLVAVGGLGVDRAFACACGEPGLEMKWVPESRVWPVSGMAA